jgi:DNA polymerase-1
MLTMTSVKTYAYDCETSVLDPWEKGSGVHVEVYLRLESPFTSFRRKSLHPSEAKVPGSLGVEEYILTGHNMWTFDALWLHADALANAEEVHDTLAMGALLARPGEGVGLNEMSKRYLDEEKVDIDLLPMLKKLRDESIPKAGRNKILSDIQVYCEQDAKLAGRLYEKLPALLKQDGLWEVYTMWREFSEALIAMMRRGVRVSQYMRRTMAADADVDRVAAHREFIAQTGVSEGANDFNINSGPQMAELLYDVLALPVLKRTGTGKPSVDKETLNKLLRKIPEGPEFGPIRKTLDAVLRYRDAAKYQSTFLNRLAPDHPKTYIGKDDAVHTTYKLVYDGHSGARSGRLSSSNPNLQNLPGSKGIKRLFVTPNDEKYGRIWFSSDYSQIELRVVATLAQEMKMLNAFAAGNDIHADTAVRVFDYTLTDYMNALDEGDVIAIRQRKIAKTLNFAILYGMGAMALGEKLTANGVPTTTGAAAKMIHQYNEAYPKVYDWKKKIRAEVNETGEVRSVFGFPRRWAYVNETAVRQAVNTPVQNTAAWITLQALSWMHQDGIVTPLVTVHDEIGGVYKQDSITDYEVAKYLQEVMVTRMEDYLVEAWNFPVPLAVDMKVGSTTWQGD